MKKCFQRQIAELLEESTSILDATKDLLPLLEQMSEKIQEINNLSGASERANNIRDEIKLKGWATVSNLYSPKNNLEDPGAMYLFEFYKVVYEDMKKKGEIS